MKFTDRLAHAWNAFRLNDSNTIFDSSRNVNYIAAMSSSDRLDRNPIRIGTERSILASIYNRIAIDVAAIEIRHARVDQNRQFLEEIPSNLNDCLAVSANKDQTARAFFMDVTLSLFEEGNIAIVAVDTDIDYTRSNSYDIMSMRVGKVKQWYPDDVQVEVYNDNTGRREEITLPKSKVALIENPLYQVMNEPNSTLQRLKHKLALLDATDDKQNSDKLNMIIQLPYVVKSKTKMEQADERLKQVEMQLTESKYGIAYMDSTEKIVQLGHPIENNLIEQIEYFTNQLYAQLGLTPEVFNGTADERAMLNYNNRTIEPIVSSIVDEMHRKFLTKTARTQGQAIIYFRNPFSLVTVDNLAEMADKFTRNEILNSNEFRGLLGYKPVDTQRANELLNKNINPVEQPMESDSSMLEQPVETDNYTVEQQTGVNQENPYPYEETYDTQTIPNQNETIENNSDENQNDEDYEFSLDEMSDEDLSNYVDKLDAYAEELGEYENTIDMFDGDDNDSSNDVKDYVEDYYSTSLNSIKQLEEV